MLLQRGAADSPTFRALLHAIEHSDVIVHVEQVMQSAHGLAGATRFITRAGGYRYVRITLYGVWPVHQAIAILGHELQHASEMASAGWVIDQQTCLELFQTIGRRTCDDQHICFDTEAAVIAGHRVWSDLGHADAGE